MQSIHRRSLRRAVELPCELVTSHADQPLLYWATDLSPNGIFVETTRPMAPGEQVVVAFKPLVWWHNRELVVFAEVSRAVGERGSTGATGMGLEFLDLSEHESRALRAWLRGRPPQTPRRRARRTNLRYMPPPRYLVAA